MPRVTFVDSAPVVIKETNINEMHTPSEGMLHINSKEFVNFNSKNAEATMTIKAIATSAVTYKIQTTSPEKFRVRPRCGIIQPNQETFINIWLKSEHTLSEGKDKFLVMAMIAPGGECGGADVTELWRSKSPTSEDVEQHRLVCRFEESKSKAPLDCANKSSKGSMDCSKKSGANVDPATAMERQLAFTQNLQYVTLALLFLLFAGFGFLMYQQMGQHASTCPKATAYSCAKRK
ncbi:motile sperm domain-containing protein 2 isoform X4 [Drosophila erecta]|uniref:motile sperm domain-containing protein 2 isoform X4 n=1 Tax=Drosophila erecta TaxID=7220 RepID=UPI000F05898E|nr:motile sperm domain-containing protein 2 isoform X4 [Drosophila erecta]